MASPQYTFNHLGQLSHTAANMPCIYDRANGVYRPMEQSDFSSTGIGNPLSFMDFTGVLPRESGGVYEIDNYLGYNTLGAYIAPPSGGQVKFQGAFSDNLWTDITLRSIGADGYTKYSNHAFENYIGSIASLPKIRIITIESGSDNGFIGGRLIKEVSTLEGQENAPPPHRYGSQPKHFGFGFEAAIVNGSGLWTPAHNKRFIVTDVQMSIEGNNSVVILFESGNNNLINPLKWVSCVRGAAQSINFSSNFTTPYVADSIATPLMIAVSTSAFVYGVICGYEAD
jgi:hypothetical protein